MERCYGLFENADLIEHGIDTSHKTRYNPKIDQYFVRTAQSLNVRQVVLANRSLSSFEDLFMA